MTWSRVPQDHVAFVDFVEFFKQTKIYMTKFACVRYQTLWYK